MGPHLQHKTDLRKAV